MLCTGSKICLEVRIHVTGKYYLQVHGMCAHRSWGGMILLTCSISAFSTPSISAFFRPEVCLAEVIQAEECSGVMSLSCCHRSHPE